MRKPVKLSGKRAGEFHREELVTSEKDGVFGGYRLQAEQSVDASLFNRYSKEKGCKNHNVPCPSGLSDPKRQDSHQKNGVIARVSSDSVERQELPVPTKRFLGENGGTAQGVCILY